MKPFASIARFLRTTTSWLLASVLILVCIEVVYVVVRYATGQNKKRVSDRILNNSVFRDKPWAAAMFNEQTAVRMEYEQYLGWRSSPFKGSFVNVSDEGIRRTSITPCDALRRKDSILVFGGSSIWGVCVRDDYTIPSYLARRLCRENRFFHIANYGEKGYTFTQNVLHLALLLQAGHRPTKVLFLDGANDIATAHYAGKAGVNGLSRELEGLVEFKQSSHLHQIVSIVSDWMEHSSIILKCLRKISSFLLKREESNRFERGYSATELADLSVGIERNYSASYQALIGLSRAYGFEYHCFLQPLVFTKRGLTREEQQSDHVDSQELRFLSLETYAALERDSLLNLHNLSPVVDNIDTTCFLDFCHVSEETNEAIANKIYDVAFGNFPDTVLSKTSNGSLRP